MEEATDTVTMEEVLQAQMDALQASITSFSTGSVTGSQKIPFKPKSKS
jgi:hypothetical protein